MKKKNYKDVYSNLVIYLTFFSTDSIREFCLVKFSYNFFYVIVKKKNLINDIFFSL